MTSIVGFSEIKREEVNNAGLLRELTLGVSHDNYRKEIYVHVELCLQLQSFFKEV